MQDNIVKKTFFTNSSSALFKTEPVESLCFSSHSLVHFEKLQVLTEAKILVDPAVVSLFYHVKVHSENSVTVISVGELQKAH